MPYRPPTARGLSPRGGAADVSLALGLLSDGGGRELEADGGSGLDSDRSAPRLGVTTKRTAAMGVCVGGGRGEGWGGKGPKSEGEKGRKSEGKEGPSGARKRSPKA